MVVVVVVVVVAGDGVSGFRGEGRGFWNLFCWRWGLR